jgi:CBS domain-containing protein
MKVRDVGALPVVDGDHLIGMLTDRDIVLRTLAEGFDPSKTKARDVLTPDVVFAYEDQPLEEAARLMAKHRVGRLVVVNREKQLAGVVSLADLSIDPPLAGQALQRLARGRGREDRVAAGRT